MTGQSDFEKLFRLLLVIFHQDKAGRKNMNQAITHKTGMARLWELAFRKRALVTSACVLSVASVMLSFSPFIAIYYIIRELVV
jgi:hypothetical protein